MISTDQLVFRIQKIFGLCRPHGIILGWDEARYFSSISALCSDCKVVNNTDFNYSYCNSFELESRVNRRAHDLVITFKTSFILDVFSLHVTRYSRNRKRGNMVSEQDCDELRPILDTIRRFARTIDFQEIGSSDQDVVVDGVTLELSDVATLGKCLFDDFE